MQRNKDLKRLKASFAFNHINRIKEEQSNELGGNFKSHIKSIPMYIYNNGLISTLSFIFYKSKKDKSYEDIKKILTEYFKKDFVYRSKDFVKNKNNETCIIDSLISCNSNDYRKFTLEVLSILEWLIRFSDEMLEGEKDE